MIHKFTLAACVGGPGYKQIYRSQHRQMEGAKCLAVSYLWKRMSLHSYDSILLDSTAYLSDTHCTLSLPYNPFVFSL